MGGGGLPGRVPLLPSRLRPVAKPAKEEGGWGKEGGVQWAVAGCHVESRLFHAGCGQWQNLSWGGDCPATPAAEEEEAAPEEVAAYAEGE